MTPAKKKEPGFEESLRRLEQIVEKLEGEDLALEESLQLFEEGVKLAGVCSQRLDQAEKKMTLLLKDKGGVLSQESFEADERD